MESRSMPSASGGWREMDRTYRHHGATRASVRHRTVT
jgi:hypothetical protein